MNIYEYKEPVLVLVPEYVYVYVYVADVDISKASLLNSLNI